MKLPVAHTRGGASHVAADPSIPCVADILDEERLVAELARAFPERALNGPSEVLDVTYLPRRHLSATFLMQDLDGPEVVTVLATPDPPAGDNGTRLLHDWNATARLFPTDDTLMALPRLCDQPAMSAMVRWLVDDASDVHAVEVVRYVPSQRCVMMLHTPAAQIFCRTAALGFAQGPADDLAALWNHPDRCFAMPEPLGFEARLNTRFERGANGTRADVEPLLSDGELSQIAAGLANLHEIGDTRPAPEAKRLGPGAALGRLERTSIRKLRLAFPALADPLHRYLVDMRDASADLGSSPDRVLHGNAHPGNVLLDDAPVLAGLDTPAIGDPAFDLALFASGLLRGALEQGRPLAPIAQTVEHLPEEYSAVGAPVAAYDYAWWVAACLVGWHADAALTALTPGSDELTAVAVELGRAVLRDGANAATITAVTG